MKKSWLIAFLLIIFTAFSRLAVADFGYENLSFDSGNFALAIKDYSLQNDRPHLPGYFLYVQVLKVFSFFSDSPALIFSILFSSLAAGILFLLFKKWFPFKNAILLTILIILNPMSWFYTSIAEMYAFDLFFSAALVLAGISGRWIYLTPLLMALGAGVRQSSPVLILPLYIFLWWNFFKTPDFSFKKFFLAHGIAAIIILAWFIPMVNSAGGFKSYLALWHTHNPVQPNNFVQNFAQFAAYSVYIFPPFLIAVVAIPFKRFLKKEQFFKSISDEKTFKNIMLFWLIPPVLFFIFFHYANAYFLLCIAALFGIIFVLFKDHVRLATLVVTVGIIIELAMFFAIPYRLPPVETFFAPKMRNISQVSVFKSRVLSAYLMGNSRIAEMGNFSRIAEEELNKAAADTSVKAVFFDPTFPVVARALQPESEFLTTTLNLRKLGFYYCYSGISQSEKSDFQNMISQSIIATRKDFADDFLKDFAFKSRNDIGELSFLKIAPNDAMRIAKLYDSLFVKR